MDTVALSSSTLAGLVIALCFAVGLNAYGCVFALGMMARMEWVMMPAGLGGLGNGWVLGVCGFLFLGEFVADKLPGFDVIWNMLQTVVRIPVAGVIAFAAASPLPMGMRMVVAVLGVGFAAVAHWSKTALRVAVVPGPEAVSNVALSLGEDGVAVGLGWMALRHPVEAGMGVVGATAVAVGLGWWGFGWIRAGWGRRFGDRRMVEGGTRRQAMVASDLRHSDLVEQVPLGH